jgi:hypothetical protein
MPTFERADKSVDALAKSLIEKFQTHKPLIAASAKIDFVMARADRDDNGHAINDAITKNGVKALGFARKMPLKDRAMGRGDAEVCLDGDWWEAASDEEQAALLDHERQLSPFHRAGSRARRSQSERSPNCRHKRFEPLSFEIKQATRDDPWKPTQPNSAYLP